MRPQPVPSPESTQRGTKKIKEVRVTAVRFKQYKVKKSGLRGAVIGLPPAQLETMGLGVGDTVSFYTGTMNGLPIVIMANASLPVLSDDPVSGQGRELREYMEAQK